MGINRVWKSRRKKSGPAFNTTNNSSICAVMRRELSKAKESAEKLGAKNIMTI